MATHATPIRLLLSISHSLRSLRTKFCLQLRSGRRTVQLCFGPALLLVSLQPLLGIYSGRPAHFLALRDHRPHHSGMCILLSVFIHDNHPCLEEEFVAKFIYHSSLFFSFRRAHSNINKSYLFMMHAGLDFAFVYGFSLLSMCAMVFFSSFLFYLP